ncbi:uncharacterized protein K452DRAFT_301660 [Aplosporella prunicola CBS 121167]|uniref:Uncharacterized protein n=1 Tax=Aplosporella prunicola CBS 121167 TaxID=1176127 RepID=A0A6A6B409_9PEZI|nr:uncharacterized protein K452DRAFT_301660 [Aplosporella prunicola CBS 121167]KAF2137944.1 hypothetical protein K452DRAFT_301660 [Aplosporella prunicola CBS 121167]
MAPAQLSSAALRAVSVLLLPVTLYLLVLLRVYNACFSSRRPVRSPADWQTILITAAPSSASTALGLARVLYTAGHKVIVASPEPVAYTSPLRLSRAVSKFRRLDTPGPERRPNDELRIVLSLILHERPTLWIPVEARDAALLKETLDAEAARPRPRVRCAVLAPDRSVARLMRDEAAFADFVASLGTEARAPDAYVVRSRNEVHRILSGGAWKQQFAAVRLEPESTAATVARNGLLPFPDQSEDSEGDEARDEVVWLPRPSMNETYEQVASLSISREQPWRLRQAVDGERYTAHALVLRGAVATFVVSRPPDDGPQTPSSARASTPAGSASSAAILPSASPLHSSLLAFTRASAAALPTAPSTHLSLNFAVATAPASTGTTTRFRPLACAAVPPPCFPRDSAAAARLAALYLSAAERDASAPAALPAPPLTAQAVIASTARPRTPTEPRPRSVAAVGALPTPPGSPCSPSPPRSEKQHYQQHANHDGSFNIATPRPSPRTYHSTPAATPTRQLPSVVHLAPLSVVPPSSSPAASSAPPPGTHHLPHTLLTLFLLPLLSLFSLVFGPRAFGPALKDLRHSALEAARRAFEWEDRVWCAWDMGPWVWWWGWGGVWGGVE